MIPFLPNIWKYGAAGLGLALVISAGWIVVLRSDVTSLESKVTIQEEKIVGITAQRDSAVFVANANAAQVDKARAERELTIALLDDVRAKETQRSEIIQNIIKEVANAKPSTCPASDALIAAHRGLLALAGTAENRD